MSEKRRTQVGTGERSERIRTYNFPQGRVTDHRIGLTLYRLEGVLEGDLDEILNALTTHYQAEALKGQETDSKSEARNPVGTTARTVAKSETNSNHRNTKLKTNE
jgi:hypothetical protein